MMRITLLIVVVGMLMTPSEGAGPVCSATYADDAPYIQCFNGANATCADTSVPSPVCSCEGGWQGVQCTQCIDDSTCEGLGLKGTTCTNGFNWVASPPGFDSAESAPITRGAALDCVLTDPFSVDQLGGGFVSFVCDADQGECELDVFDRLDDGAIPHIFHCDFSSCSQSYAQRNTLTECQRSSCTCSGDCTDSLAAILRNLQSRAFVDCDRGTGECFISQNELALFIRASCQARTCTTFQSVGEEETPGLTVAITLIVLYLVLIVLLGACFYVCRSFRRNTNRTSSIGMSPSRAMSLIMAPAKGPADALLPSANGERHYLPVALSSVGFSIHGVRILSSVTALFPPGGVHAIMGKSGAGKTTLLDVISGRKSEGIVSGTVTFGGQTEKMLGSSVLRSVMAYVPQVDALPPHLTVREVLVETAMLKLPPSTPVADIAARVSALVELFGLTSVESSVIGSLDGAGARGLSGGQIRRVSIAAALITAPPVLMLDEPTSGLDAGSALTLMTVLARYAEETSTVIILSIHQPRSAIFLQLDSVLLLVRGSRVFHGPPSALEQVLADVNLPVPPTYNPADYVLDVITAHDTEASNGSWAMADAHQPGLAQTRLGTTDELIQAFQACDSHSGAVSGMHQASDMLRDIDVSGGQAMSRRKAVAEEAQSEVEHQSAVKQATVMQQSIISRIVSKQRGVEDQAEEQEEQEEEEEGGAGADAGDEIRTSDVTYTYSYSYSEDGDDGDDDLRPMQREESPRRRKGARSSVGATRGAGARGVGGAGARFRGGEVEADADADADAVPMTTLVGGGGDGAALLAGSPGLEGEGVESRSWKSRASHWAARMYRQVFVLLHRGTMGVIRNPVLLRSHTLAALFVGLALGVMYYNVAEDLSGAQDKAGVLFFSVCLFSFGSISVVDSLGSGLPLMTRERAGGSYISSTWLSTHVMMDTLPLRVVPVLLFATVSYFLVGLRLDEASQFYNFLVVLMLVAVTAAAQTSAVTVWASSLSQASLIAVLLLLAQMLFGGLLINTDTMMEGVSWLKYLSFFNYAYEALMANELRDSLLLFNPRGTTPVLLNGNVILETYALDPNNVERNIGILFALWAGFMIITLLGLMYRVKENR